MKIMIADDHPLYTEGLKNFLEEDFEITEIVEDGETAVNEALNTKPDVILMDIGMPVIDGIEATRLIKEEMPDIKIIILTSFEEEDSIITQKRVKNNSQISYEKNQRKTGSKYEKRCN